MTVEITALRKQGGPLTKTFHIDSAGKIRNDSSECRMANGTAERLALSGPQELADVLASMPANGAMALGRLRAGLPDKIRLVAERALGKSPDSYARTQDNIVYAAGLPGYVLLDFDSKGMPESARTRIENLGGFVAAITSICPEIADAASVLRPSTSAGIYDPRTGNRCGGGGLHLFVLIADASDAARFLKVLHRRAWLAGLGWYLIGKAGQYLERSLIDIGVGNAERIVFEANPILHGGLKQEPRIPVVHEGDALGTRAACPDTAAEDDEAFKRLLAGERKRLSPEAKRAEQEFVREKTEEAIARGIPEEDARQAAEHWARGTLYPDVPLIFDRLGQVLVQDVLANPKKFEKEPLADPIEGMDYGRQTAILLLRKDGTPWIKSFAHGGCSHELRRGGSEKQFHSGANAKTARIRLPAPHPNNELTPTMLSIDEILSAIEGPEPPMRTLLGWPVEVLFVEPSGMHELTSEGANDEEDGDSSRLPAPKRWMLSRHDECSMTMLAERHIEFVDTVKGRKGTAREITVRLSPSLVKDFLKFKASKMPRVSALLTMPIVLKNGALLAANGLDRKRKIFFCIEPEILDLMPQGTPSAGAVEEAFRFLADEWLVDVKTSLAGKCVLIALAMSVLERELLGERPAFMITAGKRGGGKTTALNMISLALTAAKAAAKSWSNDPEERRKSVFAAFLQNCLMLVFDNIRLGTALSCSEIEKALTASEIEDRVLGESRNERASASTIICFTGNNITAKGDLASRCLAARIVVDRIDPENREFKHPDPWNWTLGHRGKIIESFYTILLGNPRLKKRTSSQKDQAQTRFKDWYHLVGSAVEYAAGLYRSQGCVAFKDLFQAVEADDEITKHVADALQCLDRLQRADLAAKMNNSFTSAMVASWIKLDTEDTAFLKGFFTQRDEMPSAVTIGRKLQSIADNPVQIGDRAWTLRAAKDPHKGMAEFKIETGDLNARDGP